MQEQPGDVSAVEQMLMGASQRLHGALTNLAQCLMTEPGTSMAAAIAGRAYLPNDSFASMSVTSVSVLHAFCPIVGRSLEQWQVPLPV